jgi:hypothetical protein
MADALDAISTEEIPQSVRAVARYAPDKYATLRTAVLLARLRDHRDFAPPSWTSAVNANPTP